MTSSKQNIGWKIFIALLIGFGLGYLIFANDLMTTSPEQITKDPFLFFLLDNGGWMLVFCLILVVCIIAFRAVKKSTENPKPYGINKMPFETLSKESLNSWDQIDFKDIVGQKAAKEILQKQCARLRSEQVEASSVKNNILIYGAPGTGKSMLLNAFIAQYDGRCLKVGCNDLLKVPINFGTYYLKKLLEQAREDKIKVIIIEHLDALGRFQIAEVNDDPNEQFVINTRVAILRQLLVDLSRNTEHEPINVIATAHSRANLPEVLLDLQYFEEIVETTHPTLTELVDLITLHLKPIKMRKEEQRDPSELAIHMTGFSGYEVWLMCNNAAIIAAVEDKDAVDYGHLRKSLEAIRKQKELRPVWKD